ncbi:MAG: hybrid sensor histidine kinase/response regulator [Halobacteriales archaeon]
MAATEFSLDVLLVEDNPGDARLVEHHLNAPQVADIAGEVTLGHAETLSDGLEKLDRASYDIMFLDLGLPESTGLTTLERALEEISRIPIVVLTGLDNRETAVQSIQRGAQDYLPKDGLDADTLARALRYAVERHQQEKELRRQNERLDKFASVVSHDLRNPLNVAVGRVEIARKKCDSDHLDDAAGALQRMETLIDDLLTLAQQGDTVDTLEAVDIAAVVEECWHNSDTGHANEVIKAECEVYADEGRLKQLLENLFRNAIVHNDEPVTITVGVDNEENVFYVEDDGTGIAEDKRDEIFKSGYSTSTEGTGFGLMIVEEIVNAHGWTITVTDSDTGGARFEITDVEFTDW